MSSFKPPDADKKDKPRADFSNVRSGAASTAHVTSRQSMRSEPAEPAPPEAPATPPPPATSEPAVAPATSEPAVAPAAPEPAVAAAERTYVVVSGDSLSKIARKEYGDARRWPAIFEANKDTIKNPDRIFPGQKLIIPVLEKK